jgi:Cof subfamily protein (haloacid dehalogenase superfamily)
MEQIYTIPVNEAFDEVAAKPECGCPFCVLYRRLQNNEIDIILGASMMEPDIRIRTNEEGFCLSHYNMMLRRKRMLGMGLMLESHLAEVEKKVYEQLHDRLDVYRSEPFFLEIMPKGIHKANALHKMSEVIGISKDEMVAFGDGFNDLSMIQYAGLGVAMGNAKDVVKENADFIAKTNDEDGIVEVLEKFVLD